MIVIQPLQIHVWQESAKLKPPGVRPGIHRAIGHALLNFTLKNETTHPITVALNTIEVRAIGHREPIMSLAPKTITLQPLEIAPQQYQLSNRDGYQSADWVEAIVTYQLDGRSATLFSSPVYVQPADVQPTRSLVPSR